MATLQKGISAIRIYDGMGEPMMVVDIAENSKRVREIMKEDSLKIVWESSTYIRLPAGCHVHYGSNTKDENNPAFFLLNPYEPTRKAEDCYTYEPVFHARQDMWQKYPCCVYTYDDNGKVKGRELEWSFLGTPQDALYMVEQSVLNETGQSLSPSLIGSVREKGASVVDISGQSTSIYEVLNKIAEVLDTEWRLDVENNRIVMGEYRLNFTDYPIIQLVVGEDCGNPQVNQSKEDYYTRFYVYGSDRNITQQQVTEITNSAVKKRLPLDSSKYPGGFMDLSIITDSRLEGDSVNGWALPDGVVYESEQTDLLMVYPKGLYFDEIYPASRFYITRIFENGLDGQQYLYDENGNEIGKTYYVAVSVAKEGNIWNNYKQANVLPGETLAMYFSTGILSGRTFSLSAHPKYDGTNTFFYITPDKNGAMTTPNQALAPQVGDEVTFFGYNFGEQGIKDAKARLEKTAIKYLKELVQSNMTYTIKCNVASFERKAKSDVRYAAMPLGQQIVINHGAGNVSDILRVTRVESALDIPCETTITASAKVEAKGMLSRLTETVDLNKRTEEKKIEDYKQQLIRYSQRSMSQVQETMQQINTYFSGEIQTMQAMQQVTGSEALQFVFSENIDFNPLKNPTCWYDNTAVPPCFRVKMYEDDNLYFYVKHMTLGITVISSAAATDKARLVWRLTNQRAAWQNPDMGMVYLECPKAITNGMGEAHIVVSDKKKDIDGDGFYYLLLGFINQPNEKGERSFAQMYSYTEILPGRITTDKIVSRDGGTYFDLANGEIGGNINFRGSVMTDTILIKDGEVDSLSRPYYIGGISGEPNLPTVWTGIDPHVTDTDEVRRMAMEEELPVKLTHEGFGSNIGCLKVVDSDRVDIRNSTNGLVRISTKSILEENSALSPLAIGDIVKPSKQFMTNFSAKQPKEKTTLYQSPEVINVQQTREVALNMAFDPQPTISVIVACYTYDVAERENNWVMTYNLIASVMVSESDGPYSAVSVNTCTKNINLRTTSKKGFASTTVNLPIKREHNINGKNIRIMLRLSETFSYTQQLQGGYVSFHTTGVMTQHTYKFINKVKANIIAGGGITSALDSNNYFKLYPAGNGRLTAGLRALPELESLDLIDNTSSVRLRKWGFFVYCTIDVHEGERNSRKLDIPKGYRPVRQCIIPANFEIGSDKTGRAIGCLAYDIEGKLSWYNVPSESIYYGYATAMWITVD